MANKAYKPSVAEQKLQNLKASREKNIKDVLSEWVDEDYKDMRNAFVIAKELAAEKDDTLSVKLNEEKLSQLEEAWLLKQKSIQQPITIDKRSITPSSEASL